MESIDLNMTDVFVLHPCWSSIFHVWVWLALTSIIVIILGQSVLPNWAVWCEISVKTFQALGFHRNGCYVSISFIILFFPKHGMKSCFWSWFCSHSYTRKWSITFSMWFLQDCKFRKEENLHYCSLDLSKKLKAGGRGYLHCSCQFRGLLLIIQ